VNDLSAHLNLQQAYLDDVRAVGHVGSIRLDRVLRLRVADERSEEYENTEKNSL
jgi:hypothetical protein